MARTGPLFLLLRGPAMPVHLTRQARRLNVGDPKGALTLFWSNRDAGLILLIALIAGLWRAGAPLVWRRDLNPKSHGTRRSS